jgi:UPF0716 protein FxsA
MHTPVGKRIAIALLLLPAAEVGAFLLVVWAVGFAAAIALMVLTSLAGGLVLRRAGRRRIAGMRRAMRQGGAARGAAEGNGLLFALGGILLVLPGFITDLAGAALLVRPIRRRLGAIIGRAIGARAGAAEAVSVIDLAPDEWRSIAEEPPSERRVRGTRP